jgi:hypothetical protein
MQSVKQKYPGVPVIVLSEVFDLPTDMASHATAFVRKGDPQQLVNKLNELRETGAIRELY